MVRKWNMKLNSDFTTSNSDDCGLPFLDPCLVFHLEFSLHLSFHSDLVSISHSIRRVFPSRWNGENPKQNGRFFRDGKQNGKQNGKFGRVQNGKTWKSQCVFHLFSISHPCKFSILFPFCCPYGKNLLFPFPFSFHSEKPFGQNGKQNGRKAEEQTEWEKHMESNMEEKKEWKTKWKNIS